MLKIQNSYLAILLNASSSSIWPSDKKKLVIRIQSPSCFQPCLTNETAATLSVGAMCFKEPCQLRSGFLRSNFSLIRKNRFEHLVLVGFLAPNIYRISPFSAEFLHVISSFVLCHSSILLYNGHQQIVNITRHIAGVAEKKKQHFIGQIVQTQQAFMREKKS